MSILRFIVALTAAGFIVAVATTAEAAKARKHRTTAAPVHHQQAMKPVAPQTQTVSYGDRVLGADPDPRIRYELLRDLGAAFGAND